MLLALGVGSLFNHSQTPNLDYRIDHNIAPDEELTIFYGSSIWFEDAKGESAEKQLKGVSSISTAHDHMDDEEAFLGQLTL